MKIVSSPREMQTLSDSARERGESIALVPTMGFFHEGHLSLMREGRRRAALLVVSLFVNPTQFGPSEDLTRYPRDMARDCEMMSTVPVDVVFAPESADVYGRNFQTWVEVDELTKPLCGQHRPGHFRGVTTVVAKLFNIVKPHIALFGAKDYQQLRAVQQMTRDLNFDIEIVPMPTVREQDGLAMSSRNVYLSPDDRRRALGLNRALAAARDSLMSGVDDANDMRAAAIEVLSREDGVEIEYLEVLDAETLEAPSGLDRPILVAIAARIGKTRLIDNVVLHRSELNRTENTPAHLERA
jgi:pantoate--beta-alanine ligase